MDSLPFLAAFVVLLIVFDNLLTGPKHQGGKAEPDSSESSPQPAPYQKKHYLLTASERSFFEVLRLLVGERFYIFPQVNLDKLIHVAAHTGKYFSYFQRMNRYSVDFVLCSKTDLTPVLAIELDDTSHYFTKRQIRDQKVEGILNDAGLRLLRIPRQESYTVADLKSKIESNLPAPVPAE